MIGFVAGGGGAWVMLWLLPALTTLATIGFALLGIAAGLLLVANLGARLVQQPLWSSLLLGQLCAVTGLVCILAAGLSQGG